MIVLSTQINRKTAAIGYSIIGTVNMGCSMQNVVFVVVVALEDWMAYGVQKDCILTPTRRIGSKREEATSHMVTKRLRTAFINAGELYNLRWKDFCCLIK